QILPSFILAVGIGDSVHILVIFFQHFNKYGKKKEAISHALGHSGLAVLMTSLTTAGGLLSFSTAAVAPIADLGQFAAAGVLLAFLYTVVLLPALLAIFPLKPKKSGDTEETKPIIDRLLKSIGKISINYPYRVLAISSVIIIFSICGMARIYFSHNPLKWFPATSSARIANEKIDAEMKGSTSLEVIIDTSKENGLYEPALLNKLEETTKHFEKYKSDKVFIGKAWTITTILKEINQALHSNDKDYYKIPGDKQLTAQEFLLFENSGSDDLEDVTDSQFTKTRFTIKVPFIDAIAYTGFIKYAEKYFTSNYSEEKITITGMVSLFVQVINSAIISMAKSYGYAMIIISILMILLVGRVRIGLLSMIPNIAPILVMLGIMGWANIPMDLFCLLVGSIAIGLAVDDTIHFMHNFRRYFEESNDAEDAVLRTLHTAGRAMLVTTCVLSIGFFTFMFADMKNLFNFGMLTGITISMALLSDYFIAPSLMIIVNRGKK
ncbi:MAG: MMPL family transporter, partial [Desulfobacteraceae bacterium]|nr:MMPL family transporter [Desulfobacteraceae bacterium]